MRRVENRKKSSGVPGAVSEKMGDTARQCLSAQCMVCYLKRKHALCAVLLTTHCVQCVRQTRDTAGTGPVGPHGPGEVSVNQMRKETLHAVSHLPDPHYAQCPNRQTCTTRSVSTARPALLAVFQKPDWHCRQCVHEYRGMGGLISLRCV